MAATETTDLYTTINDAVKQDALYANVEIKNTNGGTGATPVFDPLIPNTCPVSIDDLGTHVASYHSDTNSAFNQQYQVVIVYMSSCIHCIDSVIHNFVPICLMLSLHL